MLPTCCLCACWANALVSCRKYTNNNCKAFPFVDQPPFNLLPLVLTLLWAVPLSSVPVSLCPGLCNLSLSLRLSSLVPLHLNLVPIPLLMVPVVLEPPQLVLPHRPVDPLPPRRQLVVWMLVARSLKPPRPLPGKSALISPGTKDWLYIKYHVKVYF